MLSSLRALLFSVLTIALFACATGTAAPYARPAPEPAMPPRPDGAFSALESAIRDVHGPDVSGFELIDRNEDALRWRLVLIDSARHSIDAQYFLWQGDDAGRILTEHLLDAADRGVRVRLLVDDINTFISHGTSVELRDKAAAWVDAHPNFEIRLFNPWSQRDIGGRVGNLVTDPVRLNQRMHNKALIVDNRAAILGGRNIGDDYMGLAPTFNFHDLDVLCIGPIARQASAVFDSYWNSEWVMPVSALRIQVSQAEQDASRAEMVKRLREAKSLENFPIQPQSWSAELAALPGNLQFGTSRVYSDVPEAGAIDHVMIERMHELLGSAQREVRIVNAYIIPTDRGIEALRTLHARGVDVRILTNSLASQDVPAVNSHYRKWRKPMIEAGAQIYEMRHDAAIQSLVADTPPTQAEFMGLHAKGMVVDRERVYIGSMNYDPRSARYNTEMGAFIESPGLAKELAQQIERDMQPANAWRVEMDDDGDLRWVDDAETLTHQPAQSWWQRVQDVLFAAFPESYY